ncbi:uncharacterized protein LOC131651768 [Vicia villosa]|uniref:uncharacterized protein LOC131651768 n=1 Tax=Vicia villosa TaxID=3911 RepID=UPI00273AFA62|nr:uncharacterized protein LOC131651768 [Vicia villosa]XP_058777443.1 uncharacterized protein LOC131651768 [Vicia villosa]
MIGTSMRGYEGDEYEDYDDYEDEELEEGEGYEDEEGEEYVEEEPRKPTPEELEYLELRKKLKESIRKKMKKENSISLADSSGRRKQVHYDNYGSFFGPSQPVIAQRVIQESKSLLENRHLVPKPSNTHQTNKSTNKVSNGVSKSSAHQQPPRVKEKLVKAEKLKVTRDYSFLLSDDTDIPGPSKEPPSRNTSVRNSVGQAAQVPGRSKHSLSNGGKLVRSTGDNRRPVAGASHLAPKPQSNYKLSSSSQASKASVDSRKHLGSNSGNGPGRPVGPKGMPSVGSKGMPSKMPVNTMGRKSVTPGMRNPVNGVQKPPPSKVFPSVPKYSMDQRKDVRELHKPKILPRPPPRPPVASSRAQVSKPPLKQVPKRPDVHDLRPKSKLGKRRLDEPEDDEDVSKMIRSMFNYNPSRFVDDDDDVDNMEAGFDEIVREEKRSSLIAKKEDEEQLRLLEEEEERARKRKMLKKRRVGE